MRPGLPWWSTCLLLAACSFDQGGLDNGAQPPDADPDAPDADPDAPDADPNAPDAGCPGTELTFTPLNVDPCDVPPSMGNFTFTPGVKSEIDTQTNTIRVDGAVVTNLAHAIIVQAGSGTQAMVIVANDLTIPQDTEIAVLGSRPLIVIAFGELRIDGVLDATATAEIDGPGGGLACTTGTGVAGATQSGNQMPVAFTGGSGGGGGGYGAAGGTGAHVSPQTAVDEETPGGASWGPSGFTPLFGGCPGGAGGVAMDIDDPAAGGGAGGAIELVAGVVMRIGGVVSVSGGGGRGAGIGQALQFGGGGGGGGAGGTLVLQTPVLTIMSGKLTANGGGGGEGRRDTQAGSPGGEGLMDDDVAAAGGSGVAGGNGGIGGVKSDPSGAGEVGTGATTATAGGGGGGGGVGRIHFRVTSLEIMGSDVESPPFTQGPL